MNKKNIIIAVSTIALVLAGVIGIAYAGPFSSDSSSAILSEQEVRDIVMGEYPDSEILYVQLDLDDHYREYEVKFISEEFTGKIEIDPETGAILNQELEQRYYQDSTGAAADNTITPHQNEISLEKAKEIALAEVPEAMMQSIRLDYEDGRPVYEGKMYKDGWEYEFEIDANTGQILDWDQEIDD